MFLAQSFRRRKDGSRYSYWLLRETYWDPKEKRQRHRYLGYVGPKPVLTLERARELARKLGVTLEELRRVRRLRIK